MTLCKCIFKGKNTTYIYILIMALKENVYVRSKTWPIYTFSSVTFLQNVYVGTKILSTYTFLIATKVNAYKQMYM